MLRLQSCSVVMLAIVVIVGRSGVWYCVERAILVCDGAGYCGKVGRGGVWYCVERAVLFCGGAGNCGNRRKRRSLVLCGEGNLVLWWCWCLL